MTDLVVFCLPLFLVLAALLALGIDAGAGWLQAHLPGRAVASWGVPAAMAALVGVAGVTAHGQASQRGTVADAQRIERALDAAGSRAVLLTDGYHDSEYFWYYLLGEGQGEHHDLALANQVTPGQVEEWFTTRSGPVAVATASVALADPPLYTATRGQAQDLARRGLTVTAVAPEVWRVSPSESSMSDM